jgi:putative two-component system response regulator
VDDQPANVHLLKEILKREGYTRLSSTNDSREVTALFKRLQPDIVLLDLAMPYLNGFEVMESLRLLVPERSYLPILVLTADISREAKQRALTGGAKDFLTKPFDFTEVLMRIRNLLEIRFLHIQLQDQNLALEKTVTERTSALEQANKGLAQAIEGLELAHGELYEAQLEILERLSRAAEFRDDQTGNHTQRVGQISATLAAVLGLPGEQIKLIRLAAPLHDVGKIAIPDHILLKPGRLTEDEMIIMKGHTTVGAALLARGHSEFTRMAERIALTHHERWDGTGYPQGLQGDEIPIEGRIVAVVDVFDALIHERPYKDAWKVEDALAEIERQSGQQFDPLIVDAFLAAFMRLNQLEGFEEPHKIRVF